MITVTGFKWVPPFARGHVRDLRVRWALEEAGIPYATRLIGHDEKDDPAYRACQPFGQVPCFEEDGLVLFESGAIVLHIAERSEKLLPRDPAARARTLSWLFAAINSVEPAAQNYASNAAFEPEAVRTARAPTLRVAAGRKLDPLEAHLAARDWLEGGFSCADIVMTSVLRLLGDTDLLASRPALAAYLARCEARPAFAKVLADQFADYDAHAPA